MKPRFFDFEVFPNWWLCVFGDMPDDMSTLCERSKDNFKYVHSDMPNARDLFLTILREEDYVNIGYNIKGYDLVIANGIYQGFNPQQIKILNDIIINPACAYSTREHMRIQPFAKRKYTSICYQDLMDDGAGSLKDKECVLGLNVLESSIDFNKEDLTDSDKEDVIFYCKQDVYSSMVFYREVVYPYTLAKLSLGKQFNISEDVCRKSTNAKLVTKVLDAVRVHHDDIERQDIDIPKKILKYCYDNVPNDVLLNLISSPDSFVANVFGNTVNYGNGGIHSTPMDNVYVESDAEYALVMVDAASYYPSMLIQFDCLSRNVMDKTKFKNIFDERIRIKNLPVKTTEDQEKQLALKLVLNTTFGASGNKYLDLYDPHQCTRTCRLGQLFLTALSCKLVNNVLGLKIIQTNTDGILCYFKRVDFEKVRYIMREWETVGGILLEETEVSKIWQKNVNNYLLITKDGKEKRKGGWLQETFLRPGYVTVGSLNSYVCAKAAINYLLTGKDIVDTIVNHKVLGDFAISCTKGPTYSYVVQRYSNGDERRLFKSNRVYASKDETLDLVYKIKKYKDKLSYTKMSDMPEHPKLINEDLSSYNFDELRKDIDYMYYIERAMDLLNIQWNEFIGDIIRTTDRFKY